MATDTALQIMGAPFSITPPAATVCRMVTLEDERRFFFHFERTPDAPTWLLSTASVQMTPGAENRTITPSRKWNYASDKDAADVELNATALAQFPYLPELIEHARPAF